MYVKNFQIRGPITDFDNIFYVERNEDKEALECIRSSLHFTVLGARRTGKTSLLFNLERQLGEGFIPINIELAAGDSITDEEEWYRFICKRILNQTSDRFTSGSEEQQLVPVESKIKFLDFLNDVALRVKPTDRIVMMLDEFGTVPEFLHDNFFGAIRTVAVERASDREGFQKYIFVLAGATDPRELISIESKNSPFNITKRIYMSNLDEYEIRQMIEILEESLRKKVDKRDEIITRIYEWTGGHPNLVQKTGDLMATSEITISPDSVDSAADKLVIERDDNIHRIYKNLQKDESTKQFVMEILKGDRKKFNRNIDVHAILELLGVVKMGDDGSCVIQNRIYEEMLKQLFQVPETRFRNIIIGSTVTAGIITIFLTVLSIVNSEILFAIGAFILAIFVVIIYCMISS